MNSTVNTPYYGDDRAFLDGRNARDTPTAHRRPVVLTLQHGGEAAIRIHVHNSADPKLGERGTAQGLKARVAVPDGPSKDASQEFPSHWLRVRAYLSIENPGPNYVDLIEQTMDFMERVPFRIDMVPGSATCTVLSGLDHVAEYRVSDDLFSSGALIGSQGPDGRFEAGSLLYARVEARLRLAATE